MNLASVSSIPCTSHTRVIKYPPINMSIHTYTPTFMYGGAGGLGFQVRGHEALTCVLTLIVPRFCVAPVLASLDVLGNLARPTWSLNTTPIRDTLYISRSSDCQTRAGGSHVHALLTQSYCV